MNQERNLKLTNTDRHYSKGGAIAAVAFLLAILVLSGCASRLSPYAAVIDNERKEATELLRAYNDAKAETTIDLLGAVNTRYYLEEMSRDEQDAVACLLIGQCGGQGGGVSAVELEALARVLEAR